MKKICIVEVFRANVLQSSHPKKYLPNFPTQKHPGMENFNPPPQKKSFDYHRRLKSGVPPPPPGTCLPVTSHNTWKLGQFIKSGFMLLVVLSVGL